MKFERVDNLILLANGLEHIHFEIEKKKPFYFRAAKEAHLILYRTMVEALRGTANLTITGKPKDKKRSVSYKSGNEPWCEVHKIEVEGCKKAWRYSEPTELVEIPIMNNSFNSEELSNYLQTFYDLLAKVQSPCFMRHYYHSKPVQIADKEMKLLEWLHEKIRNEFEHFTPKLLSVSIADLIRSLVLCLELSKKILFESGNVIHHKDNSAIKNDMDSLVDELKKN